jgi:hypothetical protein
MKKAVYLALLLLAFAIPMRLAADGRSKGDCYPGNGVLIASGPTSAKGEAEGRLEEIETESHVPVVPPALEPVGVDRGGAKVEIEFEANITGLNTTANNGTSTGRAEVKIKWLNPLKTGGITETEFESGCVQEIETDAQTGTNGVGEFEGEYEGTVKDFPGYPGTEKAAVLSIVVHEDADHTGRLQVDFTIELGYTCFENVYTGGDGDIELGKVTLKNLETDEFKITNGPTLSPRHGRKSYPDQHSNCAST